jgi:hypothetical protein
MTADDDTSREEQRRKITRRVTMVIVIAPISAETVLPVQNEKQDFLLLLPQIREHFFQYDTVVL